MWPFVRDFLINRTISLLLKIDVLTQVSLEFFWPYIQIQPTYFHFRNCSCFGLRKTERNFIRGGFHLPKGMDSMWVSEYISRRDISHLLVEVLLTSVCLPGTWPLISFLYLSFFFLFSIPFLFSILLQFSGLKLR